MILGRRGAGENKATVQYWDERFETTYFSRRGPDKETFQCIHSSSGINNAPLRTIGNHPQHLAYISPLIPFVRGQSSTPYLSVSTVWGNPGNNAALCVIGFCKFPNVHETLPKRGIRLSVSKCIELHFSSKSQNSIRNNICINIKFHCLHIFKSLLFLSIFIPIYPFSILLNHLTIPSFLH